MTKPALALSSAAFLSIVLLASLLVRLPTLQRVRLPSGEILYRHLEYDELIFQTLIERVQKEPLGYTLQGTPLLAHTPPWIYDRPIFFHPPAFVYLGAAAGKAGLPLPLLPVLLNLATIALVYWTGRRLYGEEAARWAAVLAAVCPVGWFVSQRIWIDNMATAATTAAFAAAVWASARPSPRSFALAGTAFGLAFLSKVPGALILPAMLLIAWTRGRSGLNAATAGSFLAPALALPAAWLLLYKLGTGDWLQRLPPADFVESNPFVKMAHDRPWHYYFSSLAALCPAYLLALWRLRRRCAADAGPAAWCAAFWLVLTGFGMMGGVFQTRFVAPAYPALALLAGAEAAALGPTGTIAFTSLAGYGMMNAAVYAVSDSPEFADFRKSVAGLAWDRVSRVAGARPAAPGPR
ncbi:MAG: glycosyltransferase family 39 protein [Elusimicrobia bacterium]|nr:glycosyltransferase family 39 protein [Elusimicrobiota bacterium]